MEKNIIILLFLTFFCSCISNYSIKKPDNLINQEKMEAILYDLSIINSSTGVVYTGNPDILKEFCPGVYGTIKPIGICMIGKK